MFHLLVLGFHSHVCSLNLVLFLKLKLACEASGCTFLLAYSLHLQYAPNGQAWLVIRLFQQRQRSCLGMQPLNAGARSGGIWAHALVLHVASLGGVQSMWLLCPQFCQPNC